MLKLNIDKEVFNPIYLKHMMNNMHRTQLYFGGSSSGKSFGLSQRAVLDVLKGRNYLVCRNVQKTIRKSVYNEIVKAIGAFKLGKYFHCNKSDLEITCLLNNKQILFAGLDDSEKIKSITPKDGVITDVWVEEATECDYKAVKQLNKRLRGKSKFKKRLTLSFNPVLQTHWIFREYFSIWLNDKQYAESDTVSILKTTYKDNMFLAEDDIYELENETDKYFYEVYTLGNWGILGNVIFKNWRVEDLSEIKAEFDNIRNGNDWGFADDPFAYIRVHIDKMRKKIYVFHELYMFGCDDETTGNAVKAIINRERIKSDSAEPKTIAKWQQMGINAVGAKKGPGSIETGIKFLKEYEIIIDIQCQHFKNEISTYRYKEDKQGNVLPTPIDKDNHLIDALRYALNDEIMSMNDWGW